MQAYKPRTWLIDYGLRHTIPTNLENRDDRPTILWFCTILQRSPNKTNKTDQNTLALISIRNLFGVQKINIEML